MTRKPRVVIYTDSVVFAGHEMTLFDAILGLIESRLFDLTVIVSRENRRFIEKLEAVADAVRLVSTPHRTEAGDVFRALLKTPKARAVIRTIERFEPDAVIVSQGAVALSACGLAINKGGKVRLISFLPMAHPAAVVRKESTITAALQDLVYRRLYALPDYFFTICNSTADQLQTIHNIDRDKIFVTYVGVDTSRPAQRNYRFEPSRGAPRKLGVVGRVEFHQKRHDFFFRTLARSSLRDSVEVYVIGDGPDLESCRELIDDLRMQERVRFIGWVDDMEDWYRKLDAIVMPSRFEGLPLVALESLYHGMPVIGSRVDGMAEILPGSWLFREGDGGEMIEAINRVLYHDQAGLIEANRRRVVETMSRDDYKHQFSVNLRQVCQAIS